LANSTWEFIDTQDEVTTPSWEFVDAAPETPAKTAGGVLGQTADVLVGIPEAAGTLASGVAGFMGGTITGAGELLKELAGTGTLTLEGLSQARKAQERVMEAMTLQPRTRFGQAVTEIATSPFVAAHAGLEKAMEGRPQKEVDAAKYALDVFLLAAPAGVKAGVARARRPAAPKRAVAAPSPRKISEAAGKPNQIEVLEKMGITEPREQIQQIVNDAIRPKKIMAERAKTPEEAAKFRQEAQELGNKLKEADGIDTEIAVDRALGVKERPKAVSETLFTIGDPEMFKALFERKSVRPDLVKEPEKLERGLKRISDLKIEDIKDPFSFQNAHQEQVIHSGWGWGNSYRNVLEGTGDILRELSTRNNKGYIEEKLRRLDNLLEKEEIGRLHPDDTFEFAQSNNPVKFELLKDLWEKQPTETPLQKLAVKLNISLLEGNYTSARLMHNLFKYILGKTKGDTVIEVKKPTPIEGETLYALGSPEMFRPLLRSAQKIVKNAKRYSPETVARAARILRQYQEEPRAEKVITEKQALKLRLASERRGAKAGIREQKRVTREVSREKRAEEEARTAFAGEKTPRQVAERQALKLRLSAEARGARVGAKGERLLARERAALKKFAKEIEERPVKLLRQAIVREKIKKNISASSFNKLKGYFDVKSLKKADMEKLLEIKGEMDRLPREAEVISRPHKEALMSTILKDEFKGQKVWTKELVKRKFGGDKDISHNIWQPTLYGKETQPLVVKVRDALWDVSDKAKGEYIQFLEVFGQKLKEMRETSGKFADEALFDEQGKMITKEQARTLTPEQQSMRDALELWFADVANTMTQGNLRNQYLPHIKRGFFEAWRKEGVMQAFKEMFKGRMDSKIDAAIWENLEFSVANEKFSRFSIPRTESGIPYTTDLGKIMEAYAKVYFFKRNFDPILPTVNAVKNIVNLPKSRDFLNQYAKSMSGQPLDLKVPWQLKLFINGAIEYTFYRNLAMNWDAGFVNTAVGKAEAQIRQGVPKFALGERRFPTKQGQKIIKEQRVVDETLDMLHDLRPLSKLRDKVDKFLFFPMKGLGRVPWGEQYIQGAMFLGELTAKEFNTGIISRERYREIIQIIEEAQGPYREATRPLIAKHVYGRTLTQHKLWMFGKVASRVERYPQNFRDLKQGDYLSDMNKRTLRELAIFGTLVYLWLDDDTFEKISLGGALADYFSYVDPKSWEWTLRAPAPAISTIADFMDLLNSIVSGEKYKTSGQGRIKGEPKAIQKALRLTPAKKAVTAIVGAARDTSPKYTPPEPAPEEQTWEFVN
jgi:hypothetical protein